jgi:hypothetical protein
LNMSEHFFGSNKGFEILAILGENPQGEVKNNNQLVTSALKVGSG